jgi:hypothetical protein
VSKSKLIALMRNRSKMGALALSYCIDSQIKAAEDRLEAWAQHCREGNSLGTGRMSVICRAMAFAAGEIATLDHIPPPPLPDEIAETDQIVCKQDPAVQWFLHLEYLTYAAAEVKARRFGCSRSEYYEIKKRVLLMIHAALNVARIQTKVIQRRQPGVLSPRSYA